MPQIDLTITDAQYAQFQAVAVGLQNKLDPLAPLLAAIVAQPHGKAKIKRWVQNNPTDARLLVLTTQLAKYLGEFYTEIGWE